MRIGPGSLVAIALTLATLTPGPRLAAQAGEIAFAIFLIIPVSSVSLC